MAIGSIGSSVSFYQQDLDYWQKQHAESAVQSADAALINVMGQAEVNLGKGMASIANGTALKRVKSQLSAAVQSVLQGASGGSTPAAATGSTTSSSKASANTAPTPATGIGTVPVTASTTLSSLGFLPGGTFSIDDGTNITNYTSTGDDSVGDLVNAINSGPAFVVASINANGKLTITARNTKEMITVQGSGTDATALGFGINNNSFTPTAPAKSASTPAAGTTATASSSNASKSSGGSTSKGPVSSMGQEIASSAVSILSAGGASGNLVDMLA